LQCIGGWKKEICAIMRRYGHDPILSEKRNVCGFFYIRACCFVVKYLYEEIIQRRGRIKGYG
jgi:hypothetical protein